MTDLGSNDLEPVQNLSALSPPTQSFLDACILETLGSGDLLSPDGSSMKILYESLRNPTKSSSRMTSREILNGFLRKLSLRMRGRRN